MKKVDLFRCYESVAEWILPHLKDRPVMLVRAPEGLQGKLFFQRHPESPIPLLRVLAMFAIETAEGKRGLKPLLPEAVQMSRIA